MYHKDSNERIVVLIDVDDVCIDTLPALVKRINETNNTDIQVSDINDWKYFKEKMNMTDFEIKRFMERAIPFIKAKEGANEFIEYLNNYDAYFDYYIVSATYSENVFMKITILKKLVPQINPEKIIFTSQKQIIRGDIIIDDGYHHLMKSPHELKICVNMPHNIKHIDGLDEMLNILRIDNLKEAIPICETYRRLRGFNNN